ncbi:homoserine kinase [Actinobaculum suis]|uniref:homoserine kinase n=1 Tax=Actinobaculum suis TaxID=1657 RepID=UPI00080873DB|nr:homoserine kinase [Actinobaculum suis]OCA94627.1 homoserine kinase [Actinobaculum suis]OCA94939.1 homoserine kinase [Actinobaculum suis]
MRIAKSSATVRVPATSGNLGPGFDCMGMAHNIWDEVSVRLITGKTTVTIEGEGADTLPTDESHLIVRAMRRAFEVAALPNVGFELSCRNRIQQGRGLGSSAAAVVAGLVLVRGLVDRPALLNDDVLLELACEFEGHPDNAAPALFGGAVVAWKDEQEEATHAARIPVSRRVRTTLLIPSSELPTVEARAVLPAEVPHRDAALNASRAAMLTLALEHYPELLYTATEDRLHQEYRATSLGDSYRIMRALRDAGWPAVISGAGPSVLVFDRLDTETAAIMEQNGFRVDYSGMATRGAHIIKEG